MAVINGKNTTGFENLHIKGTPKGPGSVVSVSSSQEQLYTFTLPNKSGTGPISGTFTVNVPVVSAATQIYTTLVTVAGIRAEDGIVASLVDVDSTARILIGAAPANGGITLSFYNMGVAQNSRNIIVAYTAVR